MEFVILGLLMIRALTQYDIRGILQRKVSPFYSASLGSIQAALKKLESSGHVICREENGSGRRRKVYSITESGRAHFLEWMMSPMAPARLEQDAPTKLFFLGHLTPNERLSVVRQIIALLKGSVEGFEAASEEAGQKAIPEELREIARFQLKTMELGMYYHKSMLAWFEHLELELEGDGDAD